MKELRVGIGVVTCNRPQFLKRLLHSLRYCNWAELVVINDGDPIEADGYNYFIQNNEHNIGVGKSKNKAMEHLLDLGCDYIFIIEDDMVIEDDAVFQAYIDAHLETGISHFMFGYHGPANKNNISGGDPCPRKVIEYPGGIRIALNQHCVGAFCFYTRQCLLDVGLNDEDYNNAFEHVDHSYMLSKKGYCPPYWWWADIADSTDYIEEQECSEKSSSIRPRADWQSNIVEGFKIFEAKHGITPVEVPNTTIDDVYEMLRDIHINKEA